MVLRKWRGEIENLKWKSSIRIWFGGGGRGGVVKRPVTELVD